MYYNEVVSYRNSYEFTSAVVLERTAYSLGTSAAE